MAGQELRCGHQHWHCEAPEVYLHIHVYRIVYCCVCEYEQQKEWLHGMYLCVCCVCVHVCVVCGVCGVCVHTCVLVCILCVHLGMYGGGFVTCHLVLWLVV